MAITGAHVLLYTSEPEALRRTLRDVLRWDHVDAGEGWLVFALPPAELGVHPAEGQSAEAAGRHQLSLMCDDLEATVEELRGNGLEVRGDPQNLGWGVATTLVLPGGVELLLYQPRHA